jgi:hypothetical protein
MVHLYKIQKQSAPQFLLLPRRKRGSSVVWAESCPDKWIEQQDGHCKRDKCIERFVIGRYCICHVSAEQPNQDGDEVADPNLDVFEATLVLHYLFLLGLLTLIRSSSD